jgi:hypothetical protein
MAHYIINKNAQTTGEHEVHNETSNCRFLPLQGNRISLGHHENCHRAVTEAKRIFPYNKIDGCYFCANSCHTR